MKIFSGTANQQLATEICNYLGIALGKSEVTRFSDNEIRVQIQENVRGEDVFVIQPTCNPQGENLQELYLLIDALKRSSAWMITAVIPYFGYARQDRKVESRVPISAKLVASQIERAGAKSVLTMDLHSGQIQGFFDIPVDNLYAQPVFIEEINKTMPDEIANQQVVIVSPDAGGVERARSYAKKLNNLKLAIIDKRRPEANKAEVMNIIGDVENMTAIIIDDMGDTLNTVLNASDALLNKSAKKVFAKFTHGIFSGQAVENLNNSKLERVTVTNTIPPSEKVINSEKAKVLSVAPIFGKAIINLHVKGSVSGLFV